MANQKLNQIYVANPATSLGDNDLMYIMQSPYSPGTDAAIIGSVFKSLFAPLTTKGDLYTYSTLNARLAVGSNGQFLQANSAAPTGINWVSPAALTKVDDTNVTLTLGGSPTSSLFAATSLTLGWTGQLSVARGGTGLSSATAYAVICGGTTSTGAFQSVASVGAAGQVLTSNGPGFLPTFQTLSGGAVIVAGTGTDSMKTTFGNDATSIRGIRIGIDPSDPTSAVIGDDGIGIGSCSYVGTRAVSIGSESRVQGTDAIGIGTLAKAGSGFGGGSKCIAIGHQANTYTRNGALVMSTVSSPHFPTVDGEWVLETDNNYKYYVAGILSVGIGEAFDLINYKGTADQSYSLQSPTNGFTITVGAGVKSLILNPVGTLATGTIIMPASPIDGQEVRVSSTQIVTALTVSANTGQTISNAPNTIGAGEGFLYIYNLSGTNWYRLY